MAFRSLLSKQRSLSSIRSVATSAAAILRLPLPPLRVHANPRGLSSSATGGAWPPPRDRGEAQNLDPETLLPGCDFKHWLVFVDTPPENTSRDDIIDGYVKMLAEAVGSEDEAKMKIYSVSTRYYYAFGAVIPREVCDKLKKMPGVQWVLPDSYLDPKTKDYGGEPFIDGKAVPYDPKFHKVWLQNRQNLGRQDRRNFDRPRGSWQGREYPNRPRPPMHSQNHEFQNGSSPVPNPNREFRNPSSPQMPNPNREFQNISDPTMHN